MMRLFIALSIPKAIRSEIAGLGRFIPGARPVPLEQMHLTLKFIGEVEGSQFLDIKEVLPEISHRPFTLCLHGVGIFPPRGMPKVLWTGVQPTDSLFALRRSIDKKLSAVGIPREKQKYSPHLTLARLNNPPLHRLQQFLAGNAFLRTDQFAVDNFCLYKSQLTANGAIHTRLKTYFLQAAAGPDGETTSDRQPPFPAQ